MDPIGRQHRRGLHLVQNRVGGAVAGRLAADRVDAAVGTALVGARHQLVIDIDLREIDRLGAAGLGHGEPLGHFVDRDDAPGPHHQRRADGELADRSAAPDRDGVAGWICAFSAAM